MKKNLAPEKIPEAVLSRARGGETPDKGSLCRYVFAAEAALAHGFRSVAEYQRKAPAIREKRVRDLERWYRMELGCRT